MASAQIRYKEKPTTLHAYKHTYEVNCPRCKKNALVLPNGGRYPSQARLVCEHCRHTEKTTDNIRYRVTVARYCDNCGKHWQKTMAKSKTRIDSISIACPHCGMVRSFKPRNEVYTRVYENKTVGDPFFNLPLWLQARVKGNLLWGYNRHHLEDIGKYVAATLRERQTTYYTTMVEKLPDFIKAAGNRKAVLKAIEKMLRAE